MAQPYYIPPDPYGDIDNANYGTWRNMGQVVDQQGDSVPSISWYTTGALPRAYFHKNGVFSLVLATRDTVAGVDTLRRLDVACAGPNANYPNPVAQQLRDHYANFYLPQCGPGGATNVKAYKRVLYPEVYPDIDMHILSGERGQKLAFVVKPGGDPKDIQLWFQGQDSPITVSGFIEDATFPTMPGLGYYFQPGLVGDFNTIADGFVMQFSDAQNLQWATYFGGQAGGLIDPQNITAVRTVGGATYAVGYASQTTGWVPQSIPLDGIVDDPMFFSPLYNYAGLTGEFTDGVITKFCNEGITGLPEQEQGSTTLQVAWSPNGELTLSGLSDGAHQLKVHDAQGRMVLQQPVRSSAGRSEGVLLRDRSAALYLLVVDNPRTGRLVPMH